LVSVSVDGLVRTWTLDDDSPTESLLRRARVTCGQKIDKDGAPIQLKSSEIKKDWDALVRENAFHGP
jgi:hypothetical protein